METNHHSSSETICTTHSLPFRHPRTNTYVRDDNRRDLSGNLRDGDLSKPQTLRHELDSQYRRFSLNVLVTENCYIVILWSILPYTPPLYILLCKNIQSFTQEPTEEKSKMDEMNPTLMRELHLRRALSQVQV